MTVDVKRKVLFLILLAVILMSVIGSGLSGIELNPGITSPVLYEDQLIITNGQAITASLSQSKFLLIVFFVLLAIIALSSIYQFFIFINWKRSLAGIFKIIKSVSIIYVILIFVVLVLPKSEKPVEVFPESKDAMIKVTAPLLSINPIIIWIIVIGLLAATVGLAIWIFKSSKPVVLTMDLMKLEAEKAKQAIMAGLNLREVILQCYKQMSLVLQQDKRIKRQSYMTAREIEYHLEKDGFPHTPVHELTQLFEAVRYGNWQPEPGDDFKAISSLEAIVGFSREAKRAE